MQRGFMIISKKAGVINEIIYNMTVVNEGKSKIYLTLDNLKILINKIIKSKSTTEYISIIPYYVNVKSHIDEELCNHMFLIESKENIDAKIIEDNLNRVFFKKYTELSDAEKEVGDYIWINYNSLNENDKKIARTLRPVIKFEDSKKFAISLQNYWNFLINEQIKSIMDEVKKDYDICDEDIIYGYICFAIESE